MFMSMGGGLRDFIPSLDDDVEEDLPERPRTRGECANEIRPCPYVSCRHHLLTEVSPCTGELLVAIRPGTKGGNRVVRTEADVDRAVTRLETMTETCSLDVAEDGQHSTVEVAEYMGITRQWAKRIEAAGVSKIRQSPDAATLKRK